MKKKFRVYQKYAIIEIHGAPTKYKLYYIFRMQTNKELKPVTNEQVFYDKFSYDKFYLPSALVYMQRILYDKFSYDKFYFTGVNVSTSLL